MPRTVSREFADAISIIPYSLSEIKQVESRIERVLDTVRDAKERKRIADEAAETIVAPAASRKAPVSEKPHYRYVNVKEGQRRKRGTALNDRIKYIPGNLKLSMRLLKFLRKSQSAYVGPRILEGRAKAKVYGRNRNNVDAYYARMVFRGAEIFRSRVMEPALAEKTPAVIQYIENEVDKLVQAGLQKNGFR